MKIFWAIHVAVKKQLFTHEMNMILKTQTADKEIVSQNHGIPCNLKKQLSIHEIKVAFYNY